MPRSRRRWAGCSPPPSRPAPYAPDLTQNDVILALAGLWEIDPATDWKARARTLYNLVFTGLKA